MCTTKIKLSGAQVGALFSKKLVYFECAPSSVYNQYTIHIVDQLLL